VLEYFTNYKQKDTFINHVHRPAAFHQEHICYCDSTLDTRAAEVTASGFSSHFLEATGSEFKKM
jgi:hypothetical protein